MPATARLLIGRDEELEAILRLLDVSSRDTTSTAEKTVRDIEIHGGCNNWYIDVGNPPRSFRVDIGYLARSGRLAEIADQQFPLLIHPARHGDPAVRELVRQMASETGAEGFIRQQQAIIGRADSRPGLGGIDCPTLVLVGDGDQLTPPELSAELADGIPGARLVVVAGSGHLTPLDQPEQVTKALVEWLQA